MLMVVVWMLALIAVVFLVVVALYYPGRRTIIPTRRSSTRQDSAYVPPVHPADSPKSRLAKGSADQTEQGHVGSEAPSRPQAGDQAAVFCTIPEVEQALRSESERKIAPLQARLSKLREERRKSLGEVAERADRDPSMDELDRQIALTEDQIAAWESTPKASKMVLIQTPGGVLLGYAILESGFGGTETSVRGVPMYCLSKDAPLAGILGHLGVGDNAPVGRILYVDRGD